MIALRHLPTLLNVDVDVEHTSGRSFVAIMIDTPYIEQRIELLTRTDQRYPNVYQCVIDQA